MRYTSLLGTLALSLILPNSLFAADTPPDVRTVIVPSAQVWCGPSTVDGLYPTNVLRQGDRVEVAHELESGWLAIRPPAGSFSWINKRFVDNLKFATYVVNHEHNPVPVFIGSSLKTDRPNKIGVKLPRGAQVRMIGQGMTDNEGTWLPIEPPEGEVRYLRQDAVAKPGVRPGAVVASSASAKPVTPPPAPDGDTLWRDAEKAERTGRTADAIRLYRLAGDANLSVNPSRAEAAYRQAHWLEQAQAGANAPGSYYYPDRNARTAPAGYTGSPYSLPTYQSGNNVFQTIGGAPAGSPNGQLVSSQAAPAVASQPGELHYRGRLQLAHKERNEAQRQYYLWGPDGKLIVYVTAGTGVDLSGYEGHTVELWGPVYFDSSNRRSLLVATQVRDMQ
jgi:hypothetical protein